MTNGPLHGVTVVDFTRHYPGPLATKLLAEMGARIIKVEFIGRLDPIRQIPPFRGDRTAADLVLNAGKQSLVIDLKQDRDRDLLAEIVGASDAVIEPYLPGQMEQWGLDYEWAQALNPRIVWLALTGYGQTGPRSQQAGHDINFMALSGALALNGPDETHLFPFPVQLADTAGGAFVAVIGLLAALLESRTSGKGQIVDVSMLDGSLPLLTLQLAHSSEMPPTPGQHPLAGSLACYATYRCADDRWVALGALEPKFWSRFCLAVQKSEWIERQFEFGQKGESLKAEVAELFASQTREYWDQLGQNSNCCLTPVLAPDELQTDAHHQARESIADANGVPHPAPPIRFQRTPCQPVPAAERANSSHNLLRAEFHRPKPDHP